MRLFHRTLRTALHSLRRNLLRSSLTCLGVVIGIAAVIAMMEIGQGSSYTIGQEIATLGSNVVQIDPSDVIKAGASTGRGGRSTLTPADCEAIRRECGAVRWAAPSVDCRLQVVYGSRNWAPRRILGTTPEYLLVRGWANLAEGASFTDDDVRDAAGVCLIGRTPARELFRGESPVGKEVRVRNVRLKVIGVLAAKGASVSGGDQDDFFIAPWTTVKLRLSGTRLVTAAAAAAAPAGQVNTLSDLYPDGQAQLYPERSTLEVVDTPQMVRFSDLDDIWVSATSPQHVPIAMRQIRQLLRERHRLDDDEPDDFRIRDLTASSEALASTSRLMTNLLLCVALISLLVGGVGIMNMMLVSVTLRTREIGLRLAVGARGRDILRQFLAEAVLLCFVGGVAGILLGRAASITITALLRWPTLPSLPAIIAAVAVSVSVGVAFGFYPAWKASRLDPIDALRYE